EALARRRVIMLDESQTASYKAVGYRARGHSAEVCASRLLRRAEGVQRLPELQKQAARRHEAKIDVIARQMGEADRFALEHKQAGAAVAASMGLAKLYGLLVTKSERRETSGFEHCRNFASVVDELVQQLGGEEAALRCLDRVREEIEKRMANPLKA